ncbi:MAG: PrpF domain-containing protein, partial [Actinomycetota bacterium]
LLPTGKAVDEIQGLPCTMIDNGMPCVILQASDLEITGRETREELEANEALKSRLEAIRMQCGPLMNLGDVTETTVPKLTMVSKPTDGGHLSTRTFIPHRCHEAIGVLGAVSVATAALLPRSPASELMTEPDGHTVRLEHPTGFFDAVVELDGNAVRRAGIVRTARPLMEGVAYPRGYP